jgi:glutamyl-tRNA(Gln) amidotransferase subunit E
LSSTEWDKIEKACDVEHGVPIMVVWGDQCDVTTAVGEILLRAREATVGVPEETRQSLPDGTTGFERVLPGPSRMYPDTDLPPIVLDHERIAQLQASMPSRPWERLAMARELNINDDLARRLIRHSGWDLFTRLLERISGSDFTPTNLASLMIDRDLPRPVHDGAAGEWWNETIDNITTGKLLAEATWHLEETWPTPLSADEARTRFEAAWKLLPDKLPADPERRAHTVTGLIMQELRGLVSGALVNRWTKEALV